MDQKLQKTAKTLTIVAIALIVVGIYLFITNGTFRTQVYGGYLSEEKILKNLKDKYGEEFEFVSKSKDSDHNYIIRSTKNKNFEFEVNTCMYQPLGIPIIAYAKMNDNYASSLYEKEFTEFLDYNQISYTIKDKKADKSGCLSYGMGRDYNVEFNQLNLEDVANQLSEFIIARKDQYPYTETKCGMLYLQGPESSYKYQELCKEDNRAKYKNDETFSEEKLLKQMWKAYGR